MKIALPHIAVSVRCQTSQPDKRHKKIEFIHRHENLSNTVFHIYKLLPRSTIGKACQVTEGQRTRFLQAVGENRAKSSPAALIKRNLRTCKHLPDSVSCKWQMDVSNKSPRISVSACTQYSKTEMTASFPIGCGSNHDLDIAPVILLSTVLLNSSMVDRHTSCKSLTEIQGTPRLFGSSEASTMHRSQSNLCMPSTMSQDTNMGRASISSTKSKIVETLDILRDVIESHPCMDQIIESSAASSVINSNMCFAHPAHQSVYDRQVKIVQALNFVRSVINSHPWLDHTHDVNAFQLFQASNQYQGMDQDGNIPARHPTGCGTYKTIDRNKMSLIPCSRVKNCPEDCHKPTDPDLLAKIIAEDDQSMETSKPSPILSRGQIPKCRTCKYQKRLTIGGTISFENIEKDDFFTKPSVQDEKPQCGILVTSRQDKDESEKTPEHSDYRHSRHSRPTEEYNNMQIQESESSSDTTSISQGSESPAPTDRGVHFHFNKLTNQMVEDRIGNKPGAFQFNRNRMENKTMDRTTSDNMSRLPRWTARRVSSPILILPEVFNKNSHLDNESSDYCLESLNIRYAHSRELALLNESLHPHKSETEAEVEAVAQAEAEAVAQAEAETIIKIHVKPASPKPKSKPRTAGSSIGFKSEGQNSIKPVHSKTKHKKICRRPPQQRTALPKKETVALFVHKNQSVYQVPQISKVLEKKPPSSKIPVYVRSPCKPVPMPILPLHAKYAARRPDSLANVPGERSTVKTKRPIRTESCINFGLSPAHAVRLRIGVFHESTTVGVQASPQQTVQRPSTSRPPKTPTNVPTIPTTDIGEPMLETANNLKGCSQNLWPNEIQTEPKEIEVQIQINQPQAHKLEERSEHEVNNVDN